MKKAEIGNILIEGYLLIVFFLSVLSCSNSTDKRSPSADIKRNNIPGYNIAHPDEIIILPAILHEISGITVIDSSSIACVQDENGIIFIYDVLRKEIRKQITFYGNGDYEGITSVEGKLYVLRSDGVLFEITNLKTPGIAKDIPLNVISENDNEGLCYDKKNDRLLIAPKNKPEKDSEARGERVIYGFDLKKRELIKRPVIDIDLSLIKKFASENKVVPPGKDKKKDHASKPDIKFKPSAIAIHPLTGRLFILSAADQILFVFNINGNIENMIMLDPEIFNMPEGITFLNNGDMFISNEGQNRNATLLRLNYNPH
jgi:uncharacterized protein YjiK